MADDTGSDGVDPADPLQLAAHVRGVGEQLQDDISAHLEELTEPVPTEEERQQQLVELVVARYRLDEHSSSDLQDLLSAHATVLADGTVPDTNGLKGLRHGLGHDEVVAAGCEVIFGHDPGQPAVEALHALALALLVGAEGSGAAGARVLLARCAEHEGDHRAMEAHIDEALAADPQYWPALIDAAWFAEDRGDAVRASSLLTETHVPAFAGEIDRLSRFIRSGEQKVGRNDPCPCGSGRKYKACCLGRGGFSLAERSGWLIDKAQGYLARSPQHATVEALAFIAAGDFVSPGPDAYRLALDEYPMIVEIALFEGGLLRRFVEQRGHLLPDDERALAESWLPAPLAVWTVEATDPDGSAATIARAGEQVRIERTGSIAHEAVGSAVLARPLAIDGLGHRVLIATGLPPEILDHVEEVLVDDLSAESLAYIVGLANHVPPATIDGSDPLVLCSVAYHLAEGTDPQEIADLLDGDLLDIDESGEWIEPEDAPDIDDDPDWAPDGSVVLYDDEVLIRAGSEARADRLKAIVERLVPQAELRAETRRPRAELIDQLLAR